MSGPLRLLLELPDRRVYFLEGSNPAVYLLADREAGGVLINAPPFQESLVRDIGGLATLRFLFLPSRLGAQDLPAWRAAGVETLATEVEAAAVGGVDITIDSRTKLTRTIDFLLMSGRTAGSCALRARNLPGLLFLGPILDGGGAEWPTVRRNADDCSYENRLIGVLGLRDLKFEYAFTDRFEPDRTPFGPGAARGILDGIERLWVED